MYMHFCTHTDTTFKVKRSKSTGRFTHRGVYTSGSCSGERGRIFTVGTYCYAAVCRRGGRRRRQAPTDGREGRGHIVARPPAYSLLALSCSTVLIFYIY